MRHAWTVSKEPSRLQSIGAVFELQFAMAARDIFDGVKRKSFAVNGVIRPAMFQPAANPGEPPLLGRVEVEVKTLRHGDLR